MDAEWLASVTWAGGPAIAVTENCAAVDTPATLAVT
jgi:hypothetical protein